MEKIKIFHAYNGFLYSPLFLADKIGLFPKNLQLVFTSSDSDAVEQLCTQDSSKGDIHFAICDPFAANFDTITPEHTDDKIYIVGSLINKVPLWIYNTNPLIKPVKEERDLLQYKNHIKSIITYRESTTGYIFGERISKILNKPLVLVEFGDEFSQNTNENLIITADVLKMVDNGLNHKNVIFPYSTRAPKEINPFLFTGILTLEENINNHLWAVLNLLGALQIAISHLNESTLQPEIKDFIKQSFANHPSIISPQNGNVEKLIEDTCNYAFVNQKLFDGFPRLDSDKWQIAWNNAKSEWKKVHPENNYPDVEKVNSPIPALLIKPNWHSSLIRLISELIRSDSSTSGSPTIVSPKLLMPKYQYIIVAIMLIISPGCVLLNVYSGFTTFDPDAIKKTVSFFYLLSIDTLFLTSTAYWGYYLSFKKYQTTDNNPFNLAVALFLAFFGGALTLLSMIL